LLFDILGVTAGENEKPCLSSRAMRTSRARPGTQHEERRRLVRSFALLTLGPG
jgi:hypothetical protein